MNTFQPNNNYNLDRYDAEIDNQNLNVENEDMNINQEEIQNDNDEEEDDRLTYTLITLDLSNLISVFEENNISFVDLLLLAKEDLRELQLQMFQRNRIYNFSLLFNKFAKEFSIAEITDFFTNNKQFIFNSSIYDRVISSNNAKRQEELNDNYLLNNNNNNFTNNNNYNNNNYYSNNNNYTNNKNYSNNNNNNYTFGSPQLKNPQLRNKKSKYPNTNSKNNKSAQVFKKYLEMKRGTEQFLEKLNKQREDTENWYYKFNTIIKKLNKNNSQKNPLNPPENETQYEMQDENYNNNNNNTNNNNNIQNDYIVDINQEYENLIGKITQLEQIEMDNKSLNHLDEIKKFMNDKGENLTLEEIYSLTNEINQMIQILSKKEKLKKSLENCNFQIQQKQMIINELDDGIKNENDNKNIMGQEGKAFEGGDNVEKIEEVHEEYSNENEN